MWQKFWIIYLARMLYIPWHILSYICLTEEDTTCSSRIIFPKNTRFCINFFTSIGLGGLTEHLHEYLKNMPRLIMQQQKHESRNSNSPDYRTASSDSEPDLACSDESDRRRRKRRRKCKAIWCYCRRRLHPQNWLSIHGFLIFKSLN